MYFFRSCVGVCLGVSTEPHGDNLWFDDYDYVMFNYYVAIYAFTV